MNKTLEHTRKYHEAFTGLKKIRYLPPFNVGFSYWLYCLVLEHGLYGSFNKFMTNAGIIVAKPHRRNDMLTCLEEHINYSLDNVPYYDANYAAIPNGWWLTDENVEYIINAVIDWSNK